MPTVYLPPVPERVLTVIHGGDYAYTVIEWEHGSIPTRRYTMFAGRRESITDVWLTNLKRENYLAKWETREESIEGAWIVRATAIPVRLTRTDRMDLLLNRIFAISCAAAEAEDWDTVARCDDRQASLESAWFGDLSARHGAWAESMEDSLNGQPV